MSRRYIMNLELRTLEFEDIKSNGVTAGERWPLWSVTAWLLFIEGLINGLEIIWAWHEEKVIQRLVYYVFHSGRQMAMAFLPIIRMIVSCTMDLKTSLEHLD